MIEILLSVVFGVIVGLSLGLTGGGGSIFTVPLLIYGIGLAPLQAVPVSLVAVSLTSLIGAVQTFRERLLAWQPAVVFSLGGMIGAPLGVLWARCLDEIWIITGFAILAITVGVYMWRRAIVDPAATHVVRAYVHGADEGPVCRLTPEGEFRFGTPCAIILSTAGIGTGILSGLFGVGGGFLIVPMLVMITRMGIHRAVATSLVIISVVGLTGAVTSLLHGDVMWGTLLPFVSGGAAGMISGRYLAARIAGDTLQEIFAGIIVLLGIGMLVHAFSIE
ncbi:MAG: sulfite exporter TauE/SafE family protein [Gammaproteobacteria bacterium]